MQRTHFAELRALKLDPVERTLIFNLETGVKILALLVSSLGISGNRDGAPLAVLLRRSNETTVKGAVSSTPHLGEDYISGKNKIHITKKLIYKSIVCLL